MASEGRPTAVVAGGGPSGALAAKVLAERGFDVHLFEAYPDPRGTPSPTGTLYPVEASKTYVISVNPRGQSALRRCGIDPNQDLDGAVLSEAVCRHNSKKGTCRVIKFNGGEHRSCVVRRRALTASLLREAENAGVKVQCGWRLKDVDFEKRTVTLGEGRESEGKAGEKKVSYDLLVGADGARSKTRTLLSNHLNEHGDGFDVRQVEDDMEYQVAILPRPWKDLLLEEKAQTPPLSTCPPASMHSWADTSRGFTSLCFPVRSSKDAPIDRFLITLICPQGELGKLQRSGLSGYASAFADLYPDWTPDSRLDLARLLAAEDNVPSTGGVCVFSQSLASPEHGVVLVGDAGHGMWPSLGQGCNCALESVSVFADAIESIKGSVSSGMGCRNVDFSTASPTELVEAIAAEYDGMRREDAHAAVDLTYNGIGGRKVRGRAHSPVIFKLQTQLFTVLSKLTAGIVPLPAMVRIMKGDGAAYSTLRRQIIVERYVMYGTIVGAAAFGLIKFLL